MRILSRKVNTVHSKEEVLNIMKDSASRYHKFETSNDCFQFSFPTHWHTKEGSIPIKGSIADQCGYTEVRIEVYGSFSLYLGLLFFCVGVLASAYGLLIMASCVYPALVSLGIGVLIFVIDLFDAIACLDSLEHRLTRKLDGTER